MTSKHRATSKKKVCKSNAIQVGAVGVALFLCAGSLSEAAAQTRLPPRVVQIAREEGEFKTFSPPACGPSGAVVFHVGLLGDRDGIYASLGGVAIPVARTGDKISGEGAVYRLKELGEMPDVNRHFAVVFSCIFERGGGAILQRTGSHGPFHFVADSSESFASFGPQVIVNSASKVAFTATVDPPGHPDREGSEILDSGKAAGFDQDGGVLVPKRRTGTGMNRKLHEGVFVDVRNDLVVIAGSDKDFLDLLSGIDMNERGHVAYRARSRTKNVAVIVDAGGGMPQIVARTGRQFRLIGEPSLSGRGEVAFYAESTADGKPMICRARWGSGTPKVLAQGEDMVPKLGPTAAISEAGHVAFVAEAKTGEVQLVVARVGRAGGVELKTLLSSFRPVGGRKLTSLKLSPRSFGGDFYVAALAGFEKGPRAILRVDAKF